MDDKVNSLYALKNSLGKDGVFFCFNGPVSQHLVMEIAEIIEGKMKLEDTNKITVLRLFSMVVEKAQNIIRYSDEIITNELSKEKLRIGTIIVGYQNDHYYVASGNMIKNSKVKRLREKLTKLQHMNRDELRKYYKKQRKIGPDQESKGAGLGFIDMAKKSSSPIEFDFKKIDEEFSFFSIKTII